MIAISNLIDLFVVQAKKEKGNHGKHHFYHDKHGKKGLTGKGRTYNDDKGHDNSGKLYKNNNFFSNVRFYN